ncbi:MAG: phosphate-selective porin O and P [Gammaproteobacteria bacterium]|nr:phosphate-selective porin O and P [Gammaproteobacteria bacterium]
MKLLKKALITAACVGSVLAAGQAQAVNWLMLQGTEKPGQAARAKVWGYIDVQYQNDNSDANAANKYIAPKLIGPDLKSQSAFNVSGARIGVRGTGMPLDSNVNYFLLAEFGNNGITEPGGAFAKLTDASITLNHIPGARVRTGLFKYPGAEEGLQAIIQFDWVNFTEVTNQLMLERFPNQNYTANVPSQPIPVNEDLQGFDNSVGAFRDVGIQLFDSFRVGDDKSWDLSYALMVGNGNGLNFSDNNSKKDIYAYFSAEKVFGGNGPFREGLKFLGWSQSGVRSYDGNNDGVSENYDRDRWGVGLKFKKSNYRFTTEFMSGDGMIFVGVANPSFGIGPGAGNPGGAGNGLLGKADGWYLEGGYRFNKSKFELELRYDTYDRLKDDKFEMEFHTWTAGVNYFFNKKTRLTLNYAARDYEAINFASGAGPNAELEGVNGRSSILLRHIF